MRPVDRSRILTLNGGSSSIRFAQFDAEDPSERRLDGKIDRIGLKGTTLTIHDLVRNTQVDHRADISSRDTVTAHLFDNLEAQPDFGRITAVGHRIVLGMDHSAPEEITPKLLEELRHIRSYDPDHLPREIELIEAFRRRHPKVPQVACFDTAFHQTMPAVAKRCRSPEGMRPRAFSATASTAFPIPT